MLQVKNYLLVLIACTFGAFGLGRYTSVTPLHIGQQLASIRRVN
jgi:hypothetical protein